MIPFYIFLLFPFSLCCVVFSFFSLAFLPLGGGVRVARLPRRGCGAAFVYMFFSAVCAPPLCDSCALCVYSVLLLLVLVNFIKTHNKPFHYGSHNQSVQVARGGNLDHGTYEVFVPVGPVIRRIAPHQSLIAQ